MAAQVTLVTISTTGLALTPESVSLVSLMYAQAVAVSGAGSSTNVTSHTEWSGLRICVFAKGVVEENCLVTYRNGVARLGSHLYIPESF